MRLVREAFRAEQRASCPSHSIVREHVRRYLWEAELQAFGESQHICAPAFRIAWFASVRITGSISILRISAYVKERWGQTERAG